MKSDLQHEFSNLLKKHRSIVQSYLKKHGLYIGQPRVLFYLEEHPGSHQQELVDDFEVTKEAVSVSINRLERSGFILKQPSNKDRRMNILTLTEKGENVVQDLKLNFNVINELMFIDLSKKETKELRRLIDIMNSSLEKRINSEEVI